MSRADPAAVTGLPPSMAGRREELTPMLSQYAELCVAHEDALVLFQVGDFYEAFCEAAREVSRVCEVTLTQREDSTGEYPMAGIPIDGAASYLDRLLAAGYRVAIADQVEDAEAASGLVDRAVTRIVTPGTVVDDELLDAGTTNYVAAVARGSGSGAAPASGGDSDPDGRIGLAAVDVATGECLVTGGDRATIAAEIDRLGPAELIAGPDAPAFEPSDADDAPAESPVDPTVFDQVTAHERLEPYVAAPERRFAGDAELRACGAVLAYAEYTQGDDGPLEYVARIRRYDPRDHLRLDAAARRGLELFENRGLGAGTGATLFDTLDGTTCALGRRCLERWLRRPLVDADRIRARHDAVAELADRSLAREAIRESLAEAYDLERLVGRVSRGRADARDLRSLYATLAVVPDLRAALVPGDENEDTDGNEEGNAAAPRSDRLCDLRARLDPLADLRELIDRAIRPDPPAEITEGGVIRDGFDDELDDLRRTEREGREWVGRLEARERERTGIDSLKVGHNQVHGYYIEVTDANLDRVPDDYHRRQTLKNAERFYTPALKEREDEIIAAGERADSLEYRLFTEVRDAAADAVEDLRRLADALGALDALAALATVAVERDYVRPAVVAPSEDNGPEDANAAHGGAGIHIEGGRHPVVERREPEFVPNDADLPRGSVALITGPNMSGKSTYMRQVALAVVLAQVGSFVPAADARLPVVDRVFTRVGASDDIAGGESTFMREMTELTRILHDATPDSLVLLDEVGRGTSTADGRAIARAAVEFVHDELGATTLFATHYHELTGLAADRERVFTLRFDATEENGDVTFLHRVRRGAASSSYGVEVAEMAGVPPPVVERARELVAETDREPGTGSDSGSTSTGDAAGTGSGTATTPRDASESEGRARKSGSGDPGSAAAAADARPEARLDAFAAGNGHTGGTSDPVAATLREVDLATTTPIEALNLLHDLQRRVDKDD